MVWKVSEIIEPERLSITRMAEEDRPRVKMMRVGVEGLTTAELIAILLGSGNTQETAVELAQRILRDCGGSLRRLARRSADELKTYDGVGDAKALALVAVAELARRRDMEDMEDVLLEDAEKMYKYIRPLMCDLDVEESYVILMNHAFKVIKHVKLSRGGLTETAVDVRLMIKEAVLNNATIIALAHNHPSGNLHPSRDDDRLTERVKEACAIMRIHMADHIIVTGKGYYSYVENGKL